MCFRIFFIYLFQKSILCGCEIMNKLNKARSTTLRKRTTAHELDLYLDSINVQSCMIKLFISGVIISCLLSFGL